MHLSLNFVSVSYFFGVKCLMDNSRFKEISRKFWWKKNINIDIKQNIINQLI